jgi:hypothetical protein
MALVPTLRLIFLLLNMIENIIGSLILLESSSSAGAVLRLCYPVGHNTPVVKNAPSLTLGWNGFHDSTAVFRARENCELNAKVVNEGKLTAATLVRLVGSVSTPYLDVSP